MLPLMHLAASLGPTCAGGNPPSRTPPVPLVLLTVRFGAARCRCVQRSAGWDFATWGVSAPPARIAAAAGRGSSVAEQRTHKPLVVSSNLTPATNLRRVPSRLTTG